MRSTERRWRRQRQQARAKARWLGALRRAAATGRANPIAHRRYIAWQEKFLDDSSKIRLIRAANQVGKTTAMIDDMLGFIRGTRHKEQRARVGHNEDRDQPGHRCGRTPSAWHDDYGDDSDGHVHEN